MPLSSIGHEATVVVTVATPTGSQQLGAALRVVGGRLSLEAATGPSEGHYDVTVGTMEPDLEDLT